MKQKIYTMLLCLSMALCTKAQIGYQVSLLNTATGEPRANVTVKAEIQITNANDEVIYTQTQNATSNDFGILSLTAGNADTFKESAVGKLPLFISVTVDGVLIGKSQILSVPVAEIATTLKSDFTLEELCGKEWFVANYYDGNEIFIFYKDGTFKFEGEGYSIQGRYTIEGNTIYAYYIGDYEHPGLWILRYINGKLYSCR